MSREDLAREIRKLLGDWGDESLPVQDCIRNVLAEANRYRWIKESFDSDMEFIVCEDRLEIRDFAGDCITAGEDIDSAIDAARLTKR